LVLKSIKIYKGGISTSRICGRYFSSTSLFDSSWKIQAIIVGLDEFEHAQVRRKAIFLSSSLNLLHSMPTLNNIILAQLADTYIYLFKSGETCSSPFQTINLKITTTIFFNKDHLMLN